MTVCMLSATARAAAMATGRSGPGGTAQLFAAYRQTYLVVTNRAATITVSVQLHVMFAAANSGLLRLLSVASLTPGKAGRSPDRQQEDWDRYGQPMDLIGRYR